jgi:hypothetical protein
MVMKSQKGGSEEGMCVGRMKGGRQWRREGKSVDDKYE